jgi:hypothetical protein
VNEGQDLRTLLAQIEDQPRHDPHHDLIRQIVRLRARDICEYCLHPTSGQFQIDHVIPAARWQDYLGGRLPVIAPSAGRRGPHRLDNFSWCCAYCNSYKRERISAQVGNQLVRLFDPRVDAWTEHFRFLNHYLFIVGITPIGVGTQRVLGLNEGGIGGPLGIRHESIVNGR